MNCRPPSDSADASARHADAQCLELCPAPTSSLSRPARWTVRSGEGHQTTSTGIQGPFGDVQPMVFLSIPKLHRFDTLVPFG